ncbi:MAG: hypothetical protein HRT88_14730 [Lentisphaeraceae bacterium]|nr:hypothetical protein [Lentisphaeraceae bacterium]
MSYDISNLKLVLLPGKDCPKELQSYHDAAFKMWKEVWDEAYKNEFSKNIVMNSDEFSRSDEIFSLFDGNKCVALMFLRTANFNDYKSRLDSYFESWPDKAIEGLTLYGNNILVNCQFTLSFEYRRSAHGINWKEVITALILKRLLHTRFDAMTGCMRKSKGMEDTAYKFGAVKLMEDLSFDKADSRIDLISFYREKITFYGEGQIKDICDSAWEKKISAALTVENVVN